MDDEGGRSATWKALGIDEPEWLDESQAPPVDAQLIEAFERRELEKERAHYVWGLLCHYRSWANAYLDITGRPVGDGTPDSD